MNIQTCKGLSTVGEFSVKVKVKGGHSIKIPEGTAVEIRNILERIRSVGEFNVHHIGQEKGTAYDVPISILGEFEQTTNSFVMKVRPSNGDNGTKCKYRMFLSREIQKDDPKGFFEQFCEIIKGDLSDCLNAPEKSGFSAAMEELFDGDETILLCLLEHIEHAQNAKNGILSHSDMLLSIEECKLPCPANETFEYLIKQGLIDGYLEEAVGEYSQLYISKKGGALLKKSSPQNVVSLKNEGAIANLGFEERIISLARKALACNAAEEKLAALRERDLEVAREISDIEKQIHDVGEKLVMLKRARSGRQTELDRIKKEMKAESENLESAKEFHQNLVNVCELLGKDVSEVIRFVQQ